MFSLKNKIIVLTGAAGFFGRYFAKALLEAGAQKIFLLDSDEKGLETLSKSLEKKFSKARVVTYVIDQYDKDRTAAILGEIIGNNKVNVLINNSFDFGKSTGFNTAEGNIENASFEQLSKSFESGVFWPFQATQIFSNKLISDKREGNVINIGSMYSLIAPNPDLYKGKDYFNPPGYSIAKSAVLALTRYVASFYGPSIRSNALIPGAIPNLENVSNNSEQNKDDEFMERLISRTLLKRVGHPNDLTGTIVFLASDASSYITGQSIVVDGGWVIT
jgi:gluconate 5-dehydrogenase